MSRYTEILIIQLLRSKWHSTTYCSEVFLQVFLKCIHVLPIIISQSSENYLPIPYLSPLKLNIWEVCCKRITTIFFQICQQKWSPIEEKIDTVVRLTWWRLDLCLNQRKFIVLPPSSLVNPTCMGCKINKIRLQISNEKWKKTNRNS